MRAAVALALSLLLLAGCTPAPRPGASPSVPAPVPTATVAAPAYRVVSLTPSSMFPPGKRTEMRLVAPSGASREQRIALLLDAVRKALAQRPDARAVTVFAGSSEEAALRGPFDVGRAAATTDAKGWTGDGDMSAWGDPGSKDRPRAVFITLVDSAGDMTPEHVVADR